MFLAGSGFLCNHGLILLLFGGECSVIIHSSFRQSKPSGMFIKPRRLIWRLELWWYTWARIVLHHHSFVSVMMQHAERAPLMDLEHFTVEVPWAEWRERYFWSLGNWLKGGRKMFNVKQEGFKTFKCLIWGGERAGDQQEVWGAAFEAQIFAMGSCPP